MGVTVETPIKSGYRVKVNMDGSDIQLTNGGNSVWISHKSLEVSDSSKVHVTLKTGHTVAGVSLRKEETVVEIDVRNVFQEFLVSMKPEILVSKQAMFRQQPATITVSFRSPPTVRLPS
ncbi:hypothetical protein FRC16_000444 [Serendipita sp. 398]|nr:hypothetical protein FRC16_000444 [Serendipita sp. 398]